MNLTANVVLSNSSSCKIHLTVRKNIPKKNLRREYQEFRLQLFSKRQVNLKNDSKKSAKDFSI